MRRLAALLLSLALAPAASAQDETDPPCPPGVAPSATLRAEGSLTATHEIPLHVQTAETWSDYFPDLDSTCSTSAQTTLDIEPARPPRYIPPNRKAGVMRQLEWFLRLGKNADLRPVEVHVRGVRRARVPSRSAPAQKLVFAFRGGDKGVSYSNGRERFRSPTSGPSWG